MDYIEEHLEDTISYAEAAKLTCCSTYHFQRMFSYIAGVPLSEYIRRRRMSIAAFELQRGNVKVIDLALRMGYDSPTAFNRAFQSVHGVPPSAARKAGVCLQAYPRITFHITIKGDAKMDYRIEKKDAFRIVGVKTPRCRDMETNFQTVPQFWLQVSQTDSIPRLMALQAGEPQALLGVCVNDGDHMEYYIAVRSDTPLPGDRPDFRAYTVPACTWAVFPGSGVMPTAIQELERRIITEWLPVSGYEYANGPDIEVYLTDDSQNTDFEIWLPIEKK
jgi:AraC family transcriptional regulator